MKKKEVKAWVTKDDKGAIKLWLKKPTKARGVWGSPEPPLDIPGIINLVKTGLVKSKQIKEFTLLVKE